MDSLMARALLDNKVGDEAIVETKIAKFKWRILAIDYVKSQKKD